MKHPVAPVIVCAVALALALGSFFACTQGTRKAASEEALEVQDAPLSEASEAVEGGGSSEFASTLPSTVSNSAQDASSAAGEASSSDGSAADGRSASSSSASSDEPAPGESAASSVASESVASADALRASLGIVEDFRPSFVHGDKGAAFQRYIVLHDTEGESSPSSVVDYWDGNGNLVAAHFVVGKDGSVVQAVPLDKITHHAGYGDAGHNELYGIVEDGRDDMAGSVPIGDWAPDYGMNAWSIGIEMVHVGGTRYYPEEQLAAVDSLIAYIDAYYGFESRIIDHKAWRSGNSDTSPEFAGYLANYQDHRTHL